MGKEKGLELKKNIKRKTNLVLEAKIRRKQRQKRKTKRTHTHI